MRHLSLGRVSHAFQPREKIKAPKLTKALAGQKPGVFTEAPDEMVRRVLRPLGNKRNIVVLNDEAHHCYRRRAGADSETPDALTGEEKAEARQRDEEARVWVTGLEAVAAKVGVKAVYDLSATPFYLRGSGWSEGTLFQWVVASAAGRSSEVSDIAGAIGTIDAATSAPTPA